MFSQSATDFVRLSRALAVSCTSHLYLLATANMDASHHDNDIIRRRPELERWGTPHVRKCSVYAWMHEENIYGRIRELYDVYEKQGLLTGWQQKRMLSELRNNGFDIKDDEIRRANQAAINEWFEEFRHGGVGGYYAHHIPEPMHLREDYNAWATEPEDDFSPTTVWPQESAYTDEYDFDDSDDPANWRRFADIDEVYQPRRLFDHDPDWTPEYQAMRLEQARAALLRQIREECDHAFNEDEQDQ